jgi:hypothetical protein
MTFLFSPLTTSVFLKKERKTYMTYKKSHKLPCCCGRLKREREREIWCGDVKRRGTTLKLFMGHNFV